MNVLFLTRLFYPHIGGVEKHTYEISQGLINRGHTVTVVTENYDNLPIKETYNKIQIYRIILDPKKNKKLQIWIWFVKNISLIVATDVVHAHDVFFWYMPFRFLFPRKKVFTTFHGYETVVPPERSAIKSRMFTEKLSTGNICIGKFIEKWYGTKADIISYGGVHATIKKGSAVTKKLRAVFIGRLEKDTGILFYEKLVQELRTQGVQISLDVYGNGPLKNLLTVGAYKGVTQYVDGVLKNYNLFFSSSYLSILDGLNHEMLVVSTYDNKLKKDYLLDTPFRDFILIGTDVTKIAKNLQELLSDKKKLVNMQTNGKKWVDTQTWNYLTDQYLSLWKK